MAEWHFLSIKEIFSRLDTHEKGLSNQEAYSRRKRVGPNILMQKEKESIFSIFFRQFKSIVILVLLVVFFLSLFSFNWAESISIFAIIIVNTLIGFFSEWKAIKTMEGLLQLGQAKATVLRNNRQVHISSKEIVPGDILVLDPNEPITADARLIYAKGLRVNEAALTGESLPVIKEIEKVDKEAELADRTNMVYKGTKVSDGEGLAVVVATGNDTEIGHIVKMASRAKKGETPLQKQLNILGKWSVYFVLSISAVIAIVGLLLGKPLILMLYTAIALGVAMVPEGLPIVAVIALARGMYIMAKKNVLINHLKAVETLGSATIIFADKTGTLTQNEMVVGRIVTKSRDFHLEEMSGRASKELKKMLKHGLKAEEDPLVLQALTLGVLCNNAKKDPKEKEGSGDPMELALLEAGKDAGITREKLYKEYPEIIEVPFDRETMMMATYHQREKGLFVAVKGAPEAVIKASKYVAGEGAKKENLTDREKKEWLEATSKLARRGLRLLAMAQKKVNSEEDPPYTHLTLVGIIGFYDPPAKDVFEAIENCRKAGIRVIMVTGDQPDTARAVAASVGIIEDIDDQSEVVISGSELKNPKELKGEAKQRMHSSNLFARITPKQKLMLIQLYQEYGEVVAMTGDGVNDAPALKKADIGIAMGKRGTDAAKQVSDMILKNDRFKYIAAAIEQGRVIFKNIRKSVMFMLCTNGAEIFSVAAASFLYWPLPLTPLQILYLNVLTDVFPALALGLGKSSGYEMSDPPRSKKERIITKRHWIGIGIWSVIIGGVVLSALHTGLIGMGMTEKEARTISFLVLGMSKLWFVFNLRDVNSPVWSNEITRNKWIWYAIALCLVFLGVAVYLPFLSFLLQTKLQNIGSWGVIVGFSLFPLFIGQIVLSIVKFKRKKRSQSLKSF